MDNIYGIKINEINNCIDTYTCMQPTNGKIPCYKLHKGDIITVAEKQIFNLFHNAYNIFRPIKREKHIKWYKPTTWFRWYWVLEVVNESNTQT